MSIIIVRAPRGLSGLHRQHGLGTVQGLDLAFFIHAKPDGPGWFGWVEIETHDVAHLLHAEWISRELEVFLPVGLEAKGVPDALDGFTGKAHLAGHEPSAPLSGLFGFLFQGLGDDRFDLPIRNPAGGAAAGRVGQPGHAFGHKAPAPLADHGAAHPQLPGDLLVV